MTDETESTPTDAAPPTPAVPEPAPPAPESVAAPAPPEATTAPAPAAPGTDAAASDTAEAAPKATAPDAPRAPKPPAPLGPDGRKIPPPPRGPVKKASDEDLTPPKPKRKRPRNAGAKSGEKSDGKSSDGRKRGPGDRPRRSRNDRDGASRGAPIQHSVGPDPEPEAVDAGPRVITDEEKAKRKERVAAAKDALSRSLTVKGDQVAPARAALKEYLRNLNDPNQPTDDRFQIMLEAPFRAPPKKKGTGFPGGRR